MHQQHRAMALLTHHSANDHLYLCRVSMNAGSKHLSTELSPSNQSANELKLHFYPSFLPSSLLSSEETSSCAMSCEIQLVTWFMSKEGCIPLRDCNKVNFQHHQVSPLWQVFYLFFSLSIKINCESLRNYCIHPYIQTQIHPTETMSS